MNENIKVYINKSNGRYFVCALFGTSGANVLCEVCTTKKRATEAAHYYANHYNCALV